MIPCFCSPLLPTRAFTGLLALLCLKHGCAQVQALEVVPELARIARLNAAANGHANRMTVTNQHSTDLPATPADVPRPRLVVAELLDTGLVGEGLLPSMRHASADLLATDFISIPDCGTVFAQLVEGTLVNELRSLPCIDSPVQFPPSCSSCSGAASPLHVHAAPLLQQRLLKPLSEPVKVLQFDFYDLPGSEGRQLEHSVKSHTAGRVDGVLVWWECGMGEGVTPLSTAPGHTAPPDHWRQCLFSLGPASGGGTTVAAGGEVAVCAAHDDHMLWFHVGQGQAPTSVPFCSCRAHALLSPQRFWHLNTSLATLQRAAAAAAAAARKNGGVVAVVSLDPILALLVLKAGARVAMDEPLDVWSSWFDANGLELSAVEPLEECAGQIGAVLAEPMFAETSGLCAAVAFFSEVDRLQPCLHDACLVMPSCCVVKGAIVECAALWLPHQPVSSIEGVQMGAINELLSGSCIAREVNMWEYEHSQLSDIITLFELRSSVQESVVLDVKIPLQRSGTAHLLCVWVETEVGLAAVDLVRPQPRSQEVAMLAGVDCCAGDNLQLQITLRENGELTCVQPTNKRPKLS